MIAPRYLLDTNILIYLIDGSSPTLRAQVERHEPGSVVTSTLCVAEALIGIVRNDQAASLDRLLTVIAPQPFEMNAARIFPDVPFRRGRLDRLIAAQALASDLIVVTNNEADFTDIPQLRVENWTR